ncbi:MAG: hypothetical protein IH624_14970 [Phycisphaerae bacterium]|nr:hypothetical protein [Phycisphaerae bacterium]
MMHAKFFVISTAGVMMTLALVAGGCRTTGRAQRESPAGEPDAPAASEAAPLPPLPLLVVDADAPLLLDDHAEPEHAAPVDGADNSHCLVCHANYRQESLAVRHARAEMGCVVCHGESFAHRNDENNTTPPERMFARDVIDDACGKCHKGHDVAPGKVIARFRKRGLDASDAGTVVCTDCHGDHRLKVRSVLWNKKTGELL